jgi:hypothetical protein
LVGVKERRPDLKSALMNLEEIGEPP